MDEDKARMIINNHCWQVEKKVTPNVFIKNMFPNDTHFLVQVSMIKDVCQSESIWKDTRWKKHDYQYILAEALAFGSIILGVLAIVACVVGVYWGYMAWLLSVTGYKFWVGIAILIGATTALIRKICF